MAESNHEPNHDDVRFEPTDVNINPVVGFLVVLGVSLAVTMVGLWAWHGALDRREADDKRPQNPMAVELRKQRPPAPQIEGLSPDFNNFNVGHSVNKPDLPTSAAKQRAGEIEALKKGWKDAQGKWHPPIDEAMNRFVEAAKKKSEDKK